MSKTWKCDRCGREIQNYQLDKHHVYISNPNFTNPVAAQLFGSVPMEDMDLCDKCMEDYVMMIKLFMTQSLRYDPIIGRLVINN